MRLEVSGFLAMALHWDARGYLQCAAGPAFSMKTVHKSVLIWYSAEEMFDLVTDVDRYPEFLPWCQAGRIRRRESPTVQIAELAIGFPSSAIQRVC